MRRRFALPLSFLTWAATWASACATPPDRPAAGPFAGKTLTIAMPPGRIADFEEVIAPEFERRTGAELLPIGLRSADQVARLRIERDRPSFDLLWVDRSEAELLGREGLLSVWDVESLPVLAEIRDNAKLDSGIAPITFASALGFLYNRERLAVPPQSWAELWRPQYRSELALFDFGSSLGPITLVMAARVHGGSIENIEPGFEKLKELSEYAVIFQSSGPANNLLVAQGEAGLTFGLASQTRDLAKKGAPVAWHLPREGALALPQGFQVVARPSEPDLAKAFLEYVLASETQTRLARKLLLVVTNQNVTLDPETAALVPLDNVIYLDFAAIGAKRGEWTDRFNREILGG